MVFGSDFRHADYLGIRSVCRFAEQAESLCELSPQPRGCGEHLDGATRGRSIRADRLGLEVIGSGLGVLDADPPVKFSRRGRGALRRVSEPQLDTWRIDSWVAIAPPSAGVRAFAEPRPQSWARRRAPSASTLDEARRTQ